MPFQTDKPKKRIVIIDAMRGFALLGILLAHISHWYAAGPLPADAHSAAAGATGIAAETTIRIPEFMSAAFVNGKFYPLFTFIFGFSFFLQIKSFTRDNKNVTLLFLRRALCLLVIGIIHQLFWMGDILMIYAILMAPLIFMRNISNKALLLYGLLMVFNVPGIIIEILQVYAHSRVDAAENHEADIFLHVILKGNLAEIMSFNFYNIPGKIKFQAVSGRFFITFGFFFLGMLTAKKGWLGRINEIKSKIYIIFLSAYAAMVLLQLLTVKLNYADTSGSIAEIIIGNVIISFQSLVAITLFTSFVTILYYNNNIMRLFTPLANLGRMALTCYLMQTVVGLFLFFHIGLGLFGVTTHIQNIAMGIVLFVLQLLFANMWFRYFNYGIIEWLLRGATHWEFQRLRKLPAIQAVI